MKKNKIPSLSPSIKLKFSDFLIYKNKNIDPTKTREIVIIVSNTGELANLKGYTINGAKQLRWETLFGSLEEGKLANFSIVSGDLFKVDEDKIKDINFEAVIFEGKVIHGELNF